MRFQLETERHLFITNVKDEKFCITDGQNFMFAHKGEIFASSSRKTIFHLQGSEHLMVGKFYVAVKPEPNPHSIDPDYTFFLQDEVTQYTLKIKSDPFDKECYARGSYAFIYNPSVFTHSKNITRIIAFADEYNQAPFESKELFEPFCLFPSSVTKSNNVVIEEYKTCTDCDGFEKYISVTPFIEFLTAFRSLWVGLKVFAENEFFHGDISFTNVVIDDGKFKFIDYDLSFYLSDVSKSTLFTEGILYTTYPLAANIIALRHVQDITKKYKEISRDKTTPVDKVSARIREKLKFGNLGNLVASNLSNDAKTMRIVSMFELPDPDITVNAFYYISLYQLAIVMAFMVESYSEHHDMFDYNHHLIEFLMYCLDFKSNGFISTDDAIAKYDDLMTKINCINF